MEDYIKNLDGLAEDLKSEIKRVKTFLNKNDYDNGTAVSTIVRNYRLELKNYLKIVIKDIEYKNKD